MLAAEQIVDALELKNTNPVEHELAMLLVKEFG